MELDVEFLPWSLLRATGFPVTVLDGLATESLTIDPVLEAEAELESARQEIVGYWPELRASAPDQRARRAVQRAASLVSEGEPLSERCATVLTGLSDWVDRWNTLAAEYRDAVNAVRLDLDTALSQARQRTAAFMNDPRFQHAVFVSNPAFARVLSRRDRRTVMTAHRYLRRFAMKCETTSFFGPVLYVVSRPAQDEPVLVGPPGPERIVVEASAALVELLRQQEPPALAWRSPLFREIPSGLERTVDGRRFRVTGDVLAYWRAADGTPVGPLAARLGPALVTSAWRLPSTELHALTTIAASYPSDLAVELAGLRDKYASAPWPERAEHLSAAWTAVQRSGGELSRAAGQHYADRELFHEDRASPFSERVSLGAPVLQRFREVASSVFPLCYLGALLTREDARDTLRGFLSGASAPLAQLAAVDLPAVSDRRARLDAVLYDLVTSAGPVLTAQQVAEALAPLWELAPHDDACLPSPDLMAVGEDLGTWVLSELHDDCSSIFGGLENPLHSDPDGLWEDFTSRVSRVVDPASMATIVSRRRSAHVTPEMPGVSIELSGVSGKPRSEVVPISSVVVPESGDAVLVDGRRRLLYPGDLASTLHRAVSLPSVVPVPIDLGVHTPRIVIGDVVYQRARWRLPLPSAESAFDKWLALQRLREQYSLPRHVFVKHPSEPKPLYLDFADPLAVLDIARLPEGVVVISECLPAPDQLWWRVDGQPHPAEFRIGCLIRRKA